MASKTIDIVISTVLKKTGIDAARASIKQLASTVGKNLMNIKAGFDIAAASLSKFVSVMSKGMEFERLAVQFKSLTGSMDLARAHLRDLQDLGRTPPFSLEQFAAASQAMMKMTGGMAGFKEQMKIVGDLAAATGNDIATVGRAFGLAYQVIRDGQDFGRAGQQLYSLGIMTKKQVSEFAELSKAGENNAAVWEKLQEVFARYKGAMKETEQTTKGLIEAIQGEATVAMTEFSSAISESAKPALEGLLGWMKRINEDGSIEDWADTTVNKMQEVVDACSAVGTAIGAIYKWTGASDAVSLTKGILGSVANYGTRAIAGLANGEGLSAFGNAGRESGDWAAKAFAGGHYTKMLADTGLIGQTMQWASGDNDSDYGYGAQTKESRRVAKAKKRAEQAAKAEAEAQRRIAEDMAKAQEETDRKKAEEKAKTKAEERTKAAKKEEEARLKAVDAEKKAREKMESDLHAKRIKNAQAEVKASQEAESAKQGVIQSAQSEFDRAFGMYRSEDKGASVIAEERAVARDYKKLQKDASRYGGKWRIDEFAGLIAAGDTAGQAAKLEEWRKSSRFTPEVESMVRAAAADKTRTTAEDELRKISKNTENLGEKLEDLLAMK